MSRVLVFMLLPLLLVVGLLFARSGPDQDFRMGD
jgi:K+-transporting ATPase A subunit